jgi:hypothetical protein
MAVTYSKEATALTRRLLLGPALRLALTACLLCGGAFAAIAAEGG